MHPIFVVVVDVLAKESPQVPLVDHDHVVEQRSPDGPDPTLCDPVLPRRSVGSSLGLDPEIADRLGDAIREDGVVVVDQETDGVLVRKRLP